MNMKSEVIKLIMDSSVALVLDGISSFIGFLTDYFDSALLLTAIGVLSILLSLFMMLSFYKLKASVAIQNKVEL